MRLRDLFAHLAFLSLPLVTFAADSQPSIQNCERALKAALTSGAPSATSPREEDGTIFYAGWGISDEKPIEFGLDHLADAYVDEGLYEKDTASQSVRESLKGSEKNRTHLVGIRRSAVKGLRIYRTVNVDVTDFREIMPDDVTANAAIVSRFGRKSREDFVRERLPLELTVSDEFLDENGNLKGFPPDAQLTEIGKVWMKQGLPAKDANLFYINAVQEALSQTSLEEKAYIWINGVHQPWKPGPKGDTIVVWSYTKARVRLWKRFGLTEASEMRSKSGRTIYVLKGSAAEVKKGLDEQTKKLTDSVVEEHSKKFNQPAPLPDEIKSGVPVFQALLHQLSPVDGGPSELQILTRQDPKTGQTKLVPYITHLKSDIPWREHESGIDDLSIPGEVKGFTYQILPQKLEWTENRDSKQLRILQIGMDLQLPGVKDIVKIRANVPIMDGTFVYDRKSSRKISLDIPAYTLESGSYQNSYSVETMPETDWRHFEEVLKYAVKDRLILDPFLYQDVPLSGALNRSFPTTYQIGEGEIRPIKQESLRPWVFLPAKNARQLPNYLKPGTADRFREIQYGSLAPPLNLMGNFNLLEAYFGTQYSWRNVLDRLGAVDVTLHPGDKK